MVIVLFDGFKDPERECILVTGTVVRSGGQLSYSYEVFGGLL